MGQPDGSVQFRNAVTAEHITSVAATGSVQPSRPAGATAERQQQPFHAFTTAAEEPATHIDHREHNSGQSCTQSTSTWRHLWRYKRCGAAAEALDRWRPFFETSSCEETCANSLSGDPTVRVSFPLELIPKLTLNLPCMSSYPTCWWLSPRAQADLEMIRLAYAELLYRWGMNLERAQVLKLCRSATGDERSRHGLAATLLKEANGLGVETGIGKLKLLRSATGKEQGSTSVCLQRPLAVASAVARYCSRESAPAPDATADCTVSDASCATNLCKVCTFVSLKQVALSLTIAILPGLTQSCASCRHLGHLDCLASWFSSNDACPTGCGCK